VVVVAEEEQGVGLRPVAQRVARPARELDVVPPRPWPLVSIRALQRQVVADVAAELQAALPRPHRSRRASWFLRLTGRRPSRLRRLPRRLLQRQRLVARPGEERAAQQLAVAAAERVAAAAVEEQAAAVAPRLCRFPELDRSSPEHLWSHGTPWPKRKSGTRMTAAQAITRAARYPPPATWYSPVSEAFSGSIAPIPDKSFSTWTPI
jgi:hypothetical protein